MASKKVDVLPERKVEGGSIVLLGNFNPAIFQPEWFAKQGIISQTEADDATIQLIHPEVASFSIEWLSLQVTKDRFTAVASDAGHLEPLRDLVIHTFSILEHTPMVKMGMNRDLHYSLASEQIVRSLITSFVSIEIFAKLILDPGLTGLRISGRRPNVDDATIQISIERSNRIMPGIYVGINEHYDFIEKKDSASELMAVLAEQWRPYQQFALRTSDDLISSVAIGVIG